MKKGIDTTFVHYGIRKDDLSMIENICEEMEIDYEWLSQEVLKAYHAKKVDLIEMSDTDVEGIVRSAINKVKQQS